MLKGLFITGASGFLGKRFVHALVDRGQSPLRVLIRSRNGETAEERAKDLGLFLPDVEVVEGDISDPSIVRSLADLSPPEQFWHIAGLTEFHASKRNQLERANVDGTRHAVALAKHWSVARFYYISTAYVAGVFDGLVPEDGLLPSPIFRNAYEETKYRAEQVVRASDVPWIVIRPSILVGDSITGEADSDKMVYGVCKVYHALAKWVRREMSQGEDGRDRRYLVRACHEAAKNCLCVDDAIRLMIDIQRNGDVGRTYHCCHPTPTTMGALHEAGAKAVNTSFISLSVGKSVSADPKQRFVDRGLQIYEPYMLGSDPRFSLDNTRLVAPHFEPAQMSGERLLHLFNIYVARLVQRDQMKAETSLDLSRLPIVKRHGTTTLAYNSMSRQFHAFTIPGVDGYLAYAMVGRTALMVGDPIAEHPDSLLRTFISWSMAENYELCAVQIGHATAHVLRACGCCVNKLGVETSVDLRQLDPNFLGMEYRGTRNNAARAERLGIRVHEKQIGECGQQIETLFADWLNRKKNHEELRLLLRPPSLKPEPDTRYFVAEREGRLVAAVFFTPIYRRGVIIGYGADIERYCVDGGDVPRATVNLMRLIELEAARRFCREGCETLALGMSPLFQITTSEFNDNPDLARLCQQLFEESTLYAFQGIAMHKRQYPCRVERPVYIATREPTAAEEVLALLKGVGLLG